MNDTTEHTGITEEEGQDEGQEGQDEQDEGSPRLFPLLPLRDIVVYPHMVVPLFVGREKSIRALDHAMPGSKQILLITQKSPNIDSPGPDDVYNFGTLATVLQLLKLPDGTRKLLVEGTSRCDVDSITEQDGMHVAEITLREPDTVETSKDMEVLLRTVMNAFEKYVKLNKGTFTDLFTSLSGIDDPGRFADTIATHLSVKLEHKQHLLEVVDVRARLELLLNIMNEEIDLLELERNIRGRVKTQMEKSQREYYLNEQMKAIQKELGELDEEQNEITLLEKKIKEAKMSKEAGKKAKAELSKLKLMQPMSAEATVVRNYLDWLLKVPWNKSRKMSRDIRKAEQVLDADHHGLEKVKQRILESLAVQQRVKKLKGPILCLVGPPGVGKTSLGRSIARATNREFIRVSLGGVRDEAEIRGHRRTYIGSMPGKVIQGMSRAGCKNPLFLFDEIDKMSMDFRGDPASALLEVLDPEQNCDFSDHYLEVSYDLSSVMFFATANSLAGIPMPLRDRMEVIHLSGYTEEEKLHIARRYLIPKQVKANGLKEGELSISDAAVCHVIRHYTREAGVRGLEREIAKICRKTVKHRLLETGEESKVAESSAKTAGKAKGKAKDKGKETSKEGAKEGSKISRTVITVRQLEKLLGVQRHRFGQVEEVDRIGQVTGLAWTEMGGDLLTVEAAVVPGKGKTLCTGQLGSVMKESIEAAMTVVRSRGEALGIESGFHSKSDVHIHVPEGAIPKDGPSAGVAMCTALVSVLTSISVKSSVAMTGEITLRGEVLPIGGLKEKLLAASRGGIKTVLIPSENERHLKEIPKNIQAGLEIIPIRWIDEVLAVALARDPMVRNVEVSPKKNPEKSGEEKHVTQGRKTSRKRPNLTH